jgi:hypothetical protein
VVLVAGSGVTGVASGLDSTCIIRNGGAQCTGTDNWGEQGNGSGATEQTSFTDVSSLGIGSNLATISAYGYYYCVTRASGPVSNRHLCWGNNSAGRFFRELPSSSHVPIAGGLDGDWLQVDAGGSHSCGLHGGGVVFCYGENTRGQMGNGTEDRFLQPAVAAGAIDVSAGVSHSCAIVNGGVQCWGQHRDGSTPLGTGVSVDIQRLPVSLPAFPAGSGATRVAAGYSHNCAIVSNQIRCWGQSEYGRLGGFHDAQVDVSRFGPGGGSVSATTGSINCGATCRFWYLNNTYVTFTATAEAGSSFLQWMGATCAEGQASATCTTNVGQALALRAVFAKPILNIDNSSAATGYDPGTDGLLLLRYLLGFRDAALVANALGNQGVTPLRNASEIASYLSTSLTSLDVDGDGLTLATTDGLMILRGLLGLPAASIATGAKQGSRSDDDVALWISALKP